MRARTYGLIVEELSIFLKMAKDFKYTATFGANTLIVRV